MKVTIGKNPKKGAVSRPERAAIGTDTANTSASGVSEEKIEIVNKRGHKSKIYARGSKMIAEYYGKPVHYRDSNNNFREIDNTLADKGDVYETKENTFGTRFNKRPIGGKIFEIEQNMCKVGLVSPDVASKRDCVPECCTLGGEGKCDSCKVLLQSIGNNTDLEYIVDSERVKENIIIKEKSDKYEYDFELTIENLAINVSEDGKSLELIKKDSGRPQFYIPSPFMFDANGERSDAVYYEIVQESPELLSLKVVADDEWINASGRTFPVTIDPQIVTAQYTGAYGYYDDDYADSVFRYHTIQNRYPDGQGTQIGNELRVYRKILANGTDTAIDSKLVILKNRLPGYLRNNNNIIGVSLKINAKPYSKPAYIVIGNDYFICTDQTEFNADITDLFLESNNEITVWLQNYYYREIYENDIYFYPPTLQIEYENKVVELIVSAPPQKTEYYPGEEFDPNGMVVKARFENGDIRQIADYTYSPTGSLATYDEGITISYGEKSLLYRGIQIYEGFNDRRPKENFENVYIIYEVDPQTGFNRDNTQKTVRIELNDGVAENSADAGTPLTAANLNKRQIRTENLSGIIKEENLPERLREKH